MTPTQNSTPTPSATRSNRAAVVVVAILIALSLAATVWYLLRDTSPKTPTGPTKAVTVAGTPRSSTGRPVPPRKLFAAIDAELYDEQHGIEDRPTFIGYVDPGDWLLFKGVDFADGPTHFVARVAKEWENSPFHRIEARLDKRDGLIIATLRPELTDSWTSFISNTTPLTQKVTGIHDLYLTFAGPSNAVGNIDWIKFVKYPRSATAAIEATTYDALRGITDDSKLLTQIDDGDALRFSQLDFGSGMNRLIVMLSIPAGTTGNSIEIRLDDLQGPAFAKLDVLPTGAPETFQVQTVGFPQPITALHDLFLTFTGGQNICNLKSIQFQP